MTYLINNSLANVQINSHNRLRITDYQSVWYNTFQFSKETDNWDEATVTGGSATWNANNSGVDLVTTTANGASVIRQTQRVIPYTPGRPAQLNQQIKFATPIANLTQRVGLFDENNGFYFELVGTTVNFVVRTSTSGSMAETRIARANWNGDKLDGAGASGITLDFTKQQLISFDYEWYGVGAITLGFIINGEIVNCHTFYTANLQSTVWASTPFLPIRLELFNTGVTASTSTLRQGSNSVICDGNTSTTPGASVSFASPALVTLSNGVYVPMISIRLQSTALNGIVKPSLLTTSAIVASGAPTAIAYKIIKNGTLTGASWANNPNTGSFSQADSSATAVSGGTVIRQGVSTGTPEDISNVIYQLGRQSLGTVSDIITVAIASLNATTTYGLASLQWTENR
jgi:hypothetical protein